MTRMLRVVSVDRPLDLLDLLREALSGRGDALLPVPVPVPVPVTVPDGTAVVIETSGSTGVP
ncbi:o-succinylbenzoate--CoA ligase, partial [Cryobacterium sp. 10I1]|nr:o-succinylbenzoate--CoA ligase [Cryobacterium sp. 10I1]